MKAVTPNSQQRALFTKTLIWWVIWGTIIGLVVGTTSAILLKTNDFLGNIRENTPWLLFLLPLGGVVIGFMFSHYGKDSSKGNNLVWEHVQHGQGTIPLRMGPIVFIGTFITVLFGGSTGRDGAAIQMGASIAEGVNKFFKVPPIDKRIVIISGISGGFGSAFGAPVTGAIFGMEAISMGKMGYEAIVPCFTASFIGHLVTTAWGVKHEHQVIQHLPQLTLPTIVRIVIASIIFGLAAMIYSRMRHWVEKHSVLYLRNALLRGFVGGVAIIALTYLIGSRDYLGRGLHIIEEAFKGPVVPYAFFAKMVFTAITMGSGFRGGEVIPLFFIGSTLGNTLSPILGLPISLLAALGMMAVFSGASNAPISCFVFSIAFFEGQGVVFFFLACLVAFIFSGHHGIYPAQKIFEPKTRLLNIKSGARIAEVEKEPTE